MKTKLEPRLNLVFFLLGIPVKLQFYFILLFCTSNISKHKYKGANRKMGQRKGDVHPAEEGGEAA
jgi:hypothetical protein